MPMTLDERTRPVYRTSRRGVCNWCGLPLRRGEGVLVECAEERGCDRVCDERCAAEAEADRLRHFPQALAGGPWNLASIPGDPDPAPNVPVVNLTGGTP